MLPAWQAVRPMGSNGTELTLVLDGHEVTISNPDKGYFAERGETKLDLVRFYEAVRDPLMAAMGGRPVLLQRCPEGAGGSSFFQKRVPASRPPGCRSRHDTQRDDLRRPGGHRPRPRRLGGQHGLPRVPRLADA